MAWALLFCPGAAEVIARGPWGSARAQQSGPRVERTANGERNGVWRDEITRWHKSPCAPAGALAVPR